MPAPASTPIRRHGTTAVHSLHRFVFSVPDLEEAAAFYGAFGLDVRDVDGRMRKQGHQGVSYGTTGRCLLDRAAKRPGPFPAQLAWVASTLADAYDRAGRFGGRTRTFTPSIEFPFLVLVVDELAFITAYQPERDLRKRAEAAIATLTSQGRSVGVCVVGALQDPRKDVISLRNLFSTRIALRLDESDQVDMVLGDGARDRGALADQISPDPQSGAGVGYVRLEASPDPVRVRAAYITDTEHQIGRLDRNVLMLVEHADVMIYDCTYTDEEYPAHKNWGHSTWQEGVRLAREVGAKTLVLFHHDPDSTDRMVDSILKQAREEFDSVFAASEGMVITVGATGDNVQAHMPVARTTLRRRAQIRGPL